MAKDRAKDMRRIAKMNVAEPISHVKTVKPSAMREARNARETRRVERAKSGFAAQSASAWAESQRDPKESRNVIKIDSSK